MRTVLKNSAEVAHYWANKTQESGRNPTDNIRFRNGSLYSYAKEIAAFRTLPNGLECVFICKYTYSNTTTGHQCDAISASSHLIQFVYDTSQHSWSLAQEMMYPSSVAPLSVWEEYNNKSAEAFESAFMPKYSKTKERRLNEARRWADEANRIAVAFDLDVELLCIDVTPETEVAMALAAREKTEEEKQAKKTQALELRQEREEWLNGARGRYRQPYDTEIQLRVSPSNPDEVETSRGARVPLTVCRRLYQSWQKQEVPEDRSVGVYRLSNIHANGIKIGCHDISKEEIERFAKVLWGEE